jgi:acyl-CoA synthetase (AMP-forming)/AMP-acid ligase II/3-hydroxymyristoyl/3-hydroxydecanoyl-(acyl carrier protein) dehydratase
MSELITSMLEFPAAADMLRLPYAGCNGDRIVAYRDGQPVNVQAFHARTAAWQRLLAGRPGRRFALFLEDSIDFAGALYGAWLAGKTIYLPGDTLHTSCSALGMAVDGFLGEFDAVWSPLSPPAWDLDGDNDGDGDGNASALPSLAADFEGLVVYTSGSSGDAQAIPKRLSQLAAEVATLEQSFGSRLGQTDVLATVSHQHIYGLLFKVLWPLAAQRAIHVRSAVFLEELLPWMQSRPCLLVSSPAHLMRFPDSAAAPAEPLQLRAVFSSGGPLPAPAAAAAGALFGCAPIEIYGSSETGGIAWRSRTESWSALPGVQWRVAAEGDDDTGDGVLEVRSPHLRDVQWLRMADRAAAVNDADNDQHFILLGRTDRIVKLAEKRISLDAIERRLCVSPLVTAVRVLLHEPASAKSPRAGIAAFVVLSDSGRIALAAGGKAALNRQLKAVLAGAVAAIALPRRWRYLDALPLNAQGKTTQAELLGLLAAPQQKPSLRPACPIRPAMPHIAVLRQDSQSVLLELRIDADLIYFDGHFDDAPVLPGVAQLNWAMILGRRYFTLPPLFSAVHTLKFQQIIVPDSTVMLELQHEPSKAALHFRLYSDAGQHSSGRISFREAAPMTVVAPEMATGNASNV